MDPIIGGLITGGANLLSGIFSSDTSAQNTQAQIAAQEQMQKESEQFNAQQAQANRDFQQQMSSTAYQRASKDMTAAGLNPMMMFGSGGPASSPSGSTASIGTPTVPTSQRTSPLANLGSAAQSVVSTAVQAKTFDKMTEEISNLQAENAKIKAATDVDYALVRKVIAGSELTEAERDRLRALQPTATLAGTSAKDVLEGMPEWLRKSANVAGFGAGKLDDVLAPIVHSAGAVRGFLPSSTTRTREYLPNKEIDEIYSRVGR